MCVDVTTDEHSQAESAAENAAKFALGFIWPFSLFFFLSFAFNLLQCVCDVLCLFVWLTRNFFPPAHWGGGELRPRVHRRNPGPPPSPLETPGATDEVEKCAVQARLKSANTVVRRQEFSRNRFCFLQLREKQLVKSASPFIMRAGTRRQARSGTRPRSALTSKSNPDSAADGRTLECGKWRFHCLAPSDLWTNHSNNN